MRLTLATNREGTVRSDTLAQHAQWIKASENHTVVFGEFLAWALHQGREIWVVPVGERGQPLEGPERAVQVFRELGRQRALKGVVVVGKHGKSYVAGKLRESQWRVAGDTLSPQPPSTEQDGTRQEELTEAVEGEGLVQHQVREGDSAGEVDFPAVSEMQEVREEMVRQQRGAEGKETEWTAPVSVREGGSEGNYHELIQARAQGQQQELGLWTLSLGADAIGRWEARQQRHLKAWSKYGTPLFYPLAIGLPRRWKMVRFMRWHLSSGWSTSMKDSLKRLWEEPEEFTGNDAVPTPVMLAVCAVTMGEQSRSMVAVNGLNRLWQHRANKGGDVRGLVTRILLGAQYAH